MGEVSAEYLFDVKSAARAECSDFDGEIETLILAAREELRTAGIKPEKCNDETDPLIKRAAIVFVKAEFGIENADREKYLQAFESIKLRLSLSVEYKEAQS